MGNSESYLTPQKIKQLEEKTHFDAKDIKMLLERYGLHDQSQHGKEGITLEDVLAMPELACNPFAKRVAWAYLKDGKENLHAEGYLMLLSVLSARSSFEEKSHALFDALDIHKEGLIRFDELFRLYKSIYNPALNDDQIKDIVVQLLQREDLEEIGVLAYEDFVKMVSPAELHEKMTLDLQLPGV